MAACSVSDDTERRQQVTETVNAFFAALDEGNAAALQELAPDLSGVDQMWRTATRDTNASISTTIDEVTVDGDSAVVTVTIDRMSGGDSTENGQSTRIFVPLRRQDERWVIADSLTAQQEIDVVPINPAQ